MVQVSGHGQNCGIDDWLVIIDYFHMFYILQTPQPGVKHFSGHFFAGRLEHLFDKGGRARWPAPTEGYPDGLVRPFNSKALLRAYPDP